MQVFAARKVHLHRFHVVHDLCPARPDGKGGGELRLLVGPFEGDGVQITGAVACPCDRAQHDALARLHQPHPGKLVAARSGRYLAHLQEQGLLIVGAHQSSVGPVQRYQRPVEATQFLFRRLLFGDVTRGAIDQIAHRH